MIYLLFSLTINFIFYTFLYWDFKSSMFRTEDLGWRFLSEQVMHHPPMVAHYCESPVNGWECWQEFTMRSKFKGKYLEIEPIGKS